MINYEEFKQIFNSSKYEPEITLVFDNRVDKYMIIKYDTYITFQKRGEYSNEIKYNSLDELYNAKTIDDIRLADDWNHLIDIIFDDTFSVISDKDYFKELLERVRSIRASEEDTIQLEIIAQDEDMGVVS